MKRIKNAEPLWYDGIVIVRIVTALLILFHGIVLFMPEPMVYNGRMVEKAHLPLPLLTAYAGKAIEFFASICLGLGFCTRFASSALALVFFVLTFFIHDANILNQETVHPFLYFLLSLMFLFIGPGKYSIDRRQQNKFKKMYA